MYLYSVVFCKTTENEFLYHLFLTTKEITCKQLAANTHLSHLYESPQLCHTNKSFISLKFPVSQNPKELTANPTEKVSLGAGFQGCFVTDRSCWPACHKVHACCLTAVLGLLEPQAGGNKPGNSHSGKKNLHSSPGGLFRDAQQKTPLLSSSPHIKRHQADAFTLRVWWGELLSSGVPRGQSFKLEGLRTPNRSLRV